MSQSKRWLQEHFRDEYVKKAQEEGYPSRAAFKLLEIQLKDKILKSGMTVVDLGAAPGGWSVVARDLVGHRGEVFALDLLPMEDIGGVTFIQGDFTEQAVLDQLLDALGDRKIDVVLSDMAPNLAGRKSIDQPRAMYLVELALDFAQKVLAPGGSFLTKVFQGEGSEAFLAAMKQQFSTVKVRKPKSSRPKSREIYVLGRGFME